MQSGFKIFIMDPFCDDEEAPLWPVQVTDIRFCTYTDAKCLVNFPKGRLECKIVWFQKQAGQRLPDDVGTGWMLLGQMASRK